MSRTQPAVWVVMAIYRPDLDALRAQVQSIAGQAGVDVRLLLFADGPMEHLAEVETLLTQYPSAKLVRFAENRGPGETFLAGLEHALALSADEEAAPRFAFADQDDIWDEDKLAASLALLETSGASLVHTDARLSDGAGQTIAPSMFAFEQREASPPVDRLFFRNNVTGMTMLFDRQLAELALACRADRPERWLHDQFIGVLAHRLRGTALLDRPTVTYRQHGANTLGARPSGTRYRRFRALLKRKEENRRYLAQGGTLVNRLATDASLPGSSAAFVALARTLQSGGWHGLIDSARLLRSMRLTNEVAFRLMADKLRYALRRPSVP